jgi:hypothetical protein
MAARRNFVFVTIAFAECLAGQTNNWVGEHLEKVKGGMQSNRVN